MEYISLNDYRYRWFFEHKDLPVDAADLSAIKPLSADCAQQIWQQIISKRANHPDLFHAEDWPKLSNSWVMTDHWQEAWDSDEYSLPESVLDHLEWDLGTVVYFCYNSEHIVETSWYVFEKYWKNFLFLDNGPILIGKRRSQTLQFFEGGQLKLGLKGQV